MKFGGICMTCRWWQRGDPKEPLGECHRAPPTFRDGDSYPRRGRWPQTLTADWCGEWEMDT